MYDDVLGRGGFRPARTDRRARAMGQWEFPSDLEHVPVMERWCWWGGKIVHRRPPEETAGVFVQTEINLAGLAPIACAAIAGWYGGAFLAWLLSWIKVRIPARAARRSRRGGAALAGIAVVVAGVASAEERAGFLYAQPAMIQNGAPPAPVYWTWAGFTRIGPTREDLAALRERGDGDAELARAIIEAVSKGGAGAPGPGTFLCVAGAPECQVHGAELCSVNPAFPWLTLQKEKYIRRPDFGGVEYVASRRSTGFFVPRFRGRGGERIGFNIASSDPAKPSYAAVVELERIGLIVVGAWLLYVVAWAASVGAARLRARRRVAQGKCPSCGYHVRDEAAG